MAKRRKTKTAPRRRHRRRVGAMGGMDLTQVLYAIGGGVAARVLVTKLPDTVGGVDITKVKPFLPLAIGYFGGDFVKSPSLKPVWLGMMVGGGVNVLQGLNVIGNMNGDAPMVAAMNRRLMAPGMNGQPTAAPFVAGRTMSSAYLY